MKKILLIGCGGHAKSVIDVINSYNSISIFGLIGKKSELGKKILGYPVIGSDESLSELRKKVSKAFICVGKIGNDERREKIIKILEELEFEFPKIISRSAVVSKFSKVGDGTFVGHSSVVNIDSKIGKNCIVNTRAVVEHDCLIGDNCHISTGAIINGGVRIGKNSFIGSNSIIRESLSLPNNTIVSAGKRVMGWPLRKN
jgi:sugar O-acyltransferase (sialic acid O-acetyltransferase NeuD family)